MKDLIKQDNNEFISPIIEKVQPAKKNEIDPKLVKNINLPSFISYPKLKK